MFGWFLFGFFGSVCFCYCYIGLFKVLQKTLILRDFHLWGEGKNVLDTADCYQLGGKKPLLFFLNSIFVAIGATDEIMEQEMSFS